MYMKIKFEITICEKNEFNNTYEKCYRKSSERSK